MKSISSNIINTFILSLLLAIAGVAFAQEDVTSVSIDSGTSVEADSESVEVESTTSAEANSGQMKPGERREKIDERKSEMVANQAERREEIEERMGTMEENREERKAEIEANREERQTNIAERKAALEVRAQERITNLAANMSNRIDAITERIQNIIDRLDTRIVKLRELGLDPSEAEASLESAQDSLDAAISEISNIDVDVAAAVGSEDARAGWATVKEKYLSVRNHIKTAHTQLRATVAALKAAAVEMKDTRGSSEAVRMDAETEVEAEAN